jgi:RNA polymerase sigma-70 factor (ECF subfamily)
VAYESSVEESGSMKGNVIPLRRPEPESEPLSDEAVAAACSSRDPVAVAELFDRFHPAIVRFLGRLLRSPEDIEDSLQCTFLEVARGRAHYDGRASVKTWILAVAANVARNQMRSTTRQDRLRVTLRQQPDEAGSSAPDARAAARLQLKRARQALDELPVERRIAFVLCALEGLSAKEAAAALGSTETAIWKRVSEARKAILASTGGRDS